MCFTNDNFSVGYLDNLSDFMMNTLHSFVKEHYKVKEDNIGIGGSSMGGIAAFYCGYYLDNIAKDDTSAVAQMAPAENVVNTPVADGYIPVEGDEELMEADAVTGATVDATSGATVDATTGATPQDVGIIEEDETGALPEKKEYKFVVTDELAAMDLKEITVADTLLYVADGNYTEHTVKADETLTRIALKYYGDKKMWPYIVKHNSLARPDDLCKGMVLVIPRLEPRK